MRVFAGVLLTVLGLILLICFLALASRFHSKHLSYLLKNAPYPKGALWIDFLGVACFLSGMVLTIFGVQLIIF